MNAGYEKTIAKELQAIRINLEQLNSSIRSLVDIHGESTKTTENDEETQNDTRIRIRGFSNNVSKICEGDSK